MRDERIEYTKPLTGTLAEAAEARQCPELGEPFSPLAQTWQVEPGAPEAEREQKVDQQKLD